MLPATLRIACVEDAAAAASALETPAEVRRFEGMASHSAEARLFVKTPEWEAIRSRIVGNGSFPLSAPESLEELARLFRYLADLGSSEDLRKAYCHAAMEVEQFSVRQARRRLHVAGQDSAAA